MKETIVAAVVAIVVTIVAVGLLGTQGPVGPQGPQGPRGVSGVDGRDGTDGVNGVDGRNGVDGKFGAVDQPDAPCSTRAGVTTCFVRQAFTATSSAICTLTPPNNATSTVESLTIRPTGTNYLGAVTLDVSTSSNSVMKFGSSTPALAVKALSFNAAVQGYVWEPAATSTLTYDAAFTNKLSPVNAYGGSTNVIFPGQNVTVRIATSTPGTFPTYQSGFCNAEFRNL